MSAQTTMNKSSETYYEIIGDECLTIKINLETRPVMYKIVEARTWRTKQDWLKWLDICRDKIEKMP